MSKSDESACSRCLSRRGLLKTGAAGVALAVLPLGCGSGASDPTGPVPAGNVSALSVGNLKVVGSNAVLGRDAGGLYAMSNVCTHEGCLMDVVGNSGAESLYCDCHGSAFSATGAVTHGPAKTALPHYHVDLAADGTITIQGGQEVASAVRTPVG